MDFSIAALLSDHFSYKHQSMQLHIWSGQTRMSGSGNNRQLTCQAESLSMHLINMWLSANAPSRLTVLSTDTKIIKSQRTTVNSLALFKFEYITKVVMSLVIFTQYHKFNHHQFYFNLLSHKFMMHKGTSYNMKFNSQYVNIIDTFLSFKARNRNVHEWERQCCGLTLYWKMALLCDISHHVSDLNTKLQGQHKLISDMFGASRAFTMRLKLFQKQLVNVNLYIFLPVTFSIRVDH